MNIDDLKKRLRLRERPVFWRALDLAMAGPTVVAAAHLKLLRRLGVPEMPRNRAALMKVGLLPIRHHYYEPFVRPEDLLNDPDEVRDLPGVALDEEGAWALLEELGTYSTEALSTADDPSELRYDRDNGTYGPCDAEAFHGLIRKLRPQRVFEVGSGNSTLVARNALAINASEGSPSRHLCIEPYEMEWLERSGVDLLRQRVEELPLGTFDELESGDILFIDSSHMIKPQGDVLRIVQQVLPRLAPGVWVHVHDIFTPRDYPARWVFEKFLLWNEQYLLEAYLAGAPYGIRLPLNHLCRQNEQRLRTTLHVGESMRPTAIWLEKNA